MTLRPHALTARYRRMPTRLAAHSAFPLAIWWHEQPDMLTTLSAHMKNQSANVRDQSARSAARTRIVGLISSMNVSQTSYCQYE
jgi:hypothetical protein